MRVCCICRLNRLAMLLLLLPLLPPSPLPLCVCAAAARCRCLHQAALSIHSTQRSTSLSPSPAAETGAVAMSGTAAAAGDAAAPEWPASCATAAHGGAHARGAAELRQVPVLPLDPGSSTAHDAGPVNAMTHAGSPTRDDRGTSVGCCSHTAGSGISSSLVAWFRRRLCRSCSGGPGGDGGGCTKGSGAGRFEGVGCNRSFFLLSSANPLRRAALWLVHSRGFDGFIIAVIAANCVCLAMGSNAPGFDSSPLGLALGDADLFFLAVFGVEMVIKWVALGVFAAKGTYLRDGE